MNTPIALEVFIKYMRDALTRFQIEQERVGAGAHTFSFWWRRFHDYVRSERPRTIEVFVVPKK